MSLQRPNNKAVQVKTKSILHGIKGLNEQGLISNEIVDLFEEKINEGGELNLILSQLKEKDKEIKEELKNTPEYKSKIEIAKKMKQARAMQERNLDETRGALETVKTMLGDAAPKELNKLLKI